MVQENINKKAGRAVKWSFLTSLIPKFVMPVINMVLARLLTPEAFGAVATINLVLTFAEVFTDAGFQKYIVQHEFENDEDLDKSTNVAFWTNTIVSLIFILVIVIARNPLASLVGSPGLGTALAISSLNILIVTFCSTQTAIHRRNMDFKKLFYPRMCTLFIPVFVTVPLAFFLRNYWALLIGTMVTNIVNAIVLAALSKWKPSLSFDLQSFKEMFSFSMWILVDAVLVWLTSYIGTFIVGRFLDSHHLGLYKTSISTVNSITSLFASSISPVMFSNLSRCQNDDALMKKTFFSYQRLVGTVLIPMGIGMFLYRELLLAIFLGKQWVEATEFLGIWGFISSITIIFANFSSTFYRSKGKPKLAMISQTILLCVLVPTLLISAQISFRALYLSRSLVTLFAILQSLVIMRVIFSVKIRETVANVFPIIVSSLVMSAVALGLQQLGNSFIWQIVSVVICVIVYFVFLVAVFPKSRKELFSLLQVNKFVGKFLPKRRVK